MELTGLSQQGCNNFILLEDEWRCAILVGKLAELREVAICKVQEEEWQDKPIGLDHKEE